MRVVMVMMFGNRFFLRFFHGFAHFGHERAGILDLSFLLAMWLHGQIRGVCMFVMARVVAGAVAGVVACRSRRRLRRLMTAFCIWVYWRAFRAIAVIIWAFWARFFTIRTFFLFLLLLALFFAPHIAKILESVLIHSTLKKLLVKIRFEEKQRKPIAVFSYHIQ